MTENKRDITAAMLPAYRDEMFDPHVMQLVRERLASDPELRAAYEALQAQEDALYDLGAALREVAPSVDIGSAVMSRLQHLDENSATVEKALFDLGDELRAGTPRLDIADAVMRTIPPRPVLEAELRATGDEIRAHAPRVDVVEKVMEDVASDRLDAVVPFPGTVRSKATLRRESPFSWRFVAAAAACILAVAGFIVMQMAKPPALRGMDMADRNQPAAATPRSRPAPETAQPREGEPLRFMPAPSDQRVSILSSALRPAAAAEPEAGEEGPAEPRPTFGIDEIIAARRGALNGQADALAMLARWGALDPAEIRRLLAEGLISSTELAGLTRFLPDEEARALLEQALEQNPNDPLLRYALAQRLMAEPARYSDALQQLAVFRGMAPENSLPYYMEAQIRLAQGDYAGAIQLLEYAATLQSASAYALENAQYHSAALQASGLPADVAQMLAAFNAGTDEYGTLTQLGYDLLSYGAYFESIGDYDTALAIYKGVQQLGLQVNQGASFSNEMLAGLDTQMAAIDALNALAQMMDIPGGLYTVEIAYTVFLEGLDFFLNYTNVLEGIVSESSTETMLRAIGQIMSTGDINYLRMR